MGFTKFFTILALSLAIGFLGCTTDKKVEAPKQERIEKNLVPPKAEVTGKNFFVQLSNLKVSMTVDTASKEIVDSHCHASGFNCGANVPSHAPTRRRAILPARCPQWRAPA